MTNVYHGRCVALAVCILILLSVFSGFPSNALPPWQGTQADSSFKGTTAGAKETQYISGPAIQDFYVNTTQCSASVQWNYSLADFYGLANATFWWNNGTTDMGNTTYTFSGSPLSGNALFNFTLPSQSENVTFQAWAFNSYNSSNTGVRWMLVYPSNTSIPYFLNLGTAITTVENANSWAATASDPSMLYAGVVLNQNSSSQLQTMIDGFMPIYQNAGPSYGNATAGTSWTTPSNAVDNNTNTKAYCQWSTVTWTNYLTINMTCLTYGSTITYNASYIGYVSNMSIDIANQTGNWLNIYNNTPTYDTAFHNIIFALSQYTALRLSFYLAYAQSSEIDLWETRGYNDSLTLRAADWGSILKWSAICNKLGFTKQADINAALGNYTMVGSLPDDTQGTGTQGTSFCVENAWGLYGYYYANQSWALAYNSSITSKWNITAAYQQFNSSVYTLGYPPLYINDSKAWSLYAGSPRFYDESACTIEDYILFSQLLNVSGAMSDAIYWWNWTDYNTWSQTPTAYPSYPDYYTYTSHQGGYNTGNYYFECEAPFFLKIISTLKYYNVNLTNWVHVLTDIGTRFLSQEWSSWQWTEFSHLTNKTNGWAYVVVHENDGNSQTRLQNTVGAWQALLGVYMQLNTTYQANMNDMLMGNTQTRQAWQMLLSNYTSLTGASALFSWSSNLFEIYPSQGDSSTWTAYAEILMWMMGIVPGNTTVAFPLEQLNYEYLQDIDPVSFQMNCNSTLKQVTIPTTGAGTITFQYGCSPVSCYFSQSGIWQISFTNSWNNVARVQRLGDLPSNMIYFQNFGSAPAHDVAVVDVTSSKTVIGQGCSSEIEVVVANQGTFSETFNVTVYAATAAIETQQVSGLNAMDQTILMLTWNTSELAYGNYTPSAYAWPIPNETNTANNNFTGGVVTVTISGDLNGDFKVSLSDLVLLANSYGSKPGDPKWNPNADINGNGVVDLSGLVTMANHYGQHYP